jgi:hypothetical protein
MRRTGSQRTILESSTSAAVSSAAVTRRNMGALKNSGLTESTLIVFVADHGIPFPRLKMSLYDPGWKTFLS